MCKFLNLAPRILLESSTIIDALVKRLFIISQRNYDNERKNTNASKPLEIGQSQQIHSSDCTPQQLVNIFLAPKFLNDSLQIDVGKCIFRCFSLMPCSLCNQIFYNAESKMTEQTSSSCPKKSLTVNKMQHCEAVQPPQALLQLSDDEFKESTVDLRVIRAFSMHSILLLFHTLRTLKEQKIELASERVMQGDNSSGASSVEASSMANCSSSSNADLANLIVALRRMLHLSRGNRQKTTCLLQLCLTLVDAAVGTLNMWRASYISCEEDKKRKEEEKEEEASGSSKATEIKTQQEDGHEKNSENDEKFVQTGKITDLDSPHLPLLDNKVATFTRNAFSPTLAKFAQEVAFSVEHAVFDASDYPTSQSSFASSASLSSPSAFRSDCGTTSSPSDLLFISSSASSVLYSTKPHEISAEAIVSLSTFLQSLMGIFFEMRASPSLIDTRVSYAIFALCSAVIRTAAPIVLRFDHPQISNGDSKVLISQSNLERLNKNLTDKNANSDEKCSDEEKMNEKQGNTKTVTECSSFQADFQRVSGAFFNLLSESKVLIRSILSNVPKKSFADVLLPSLFDGTKCFSIGKKILNMPNVFSIPESRQPSAFSTKYASSSTDNSDSTKSFISFESLKSASATNPLMFPMFFHESCLSLRDRYIYRNSLCDVFSFVRSFLSLTIPQSHQSAHSFSSTIANTKLSIPNSTSEDLLSTPPSNSSLSQISSSSSTPGSASSLSSFSSSSTSTSLSPSQLLSFLSTTLTSFFGVVASAVKFTSPDVVTALAQHRMHTIEGMDYSLLLSQMEELLQKPSTDRAQIKLLSKSIHSLLTKLKAADRQQFVSHSFLSGISSFTDSKKKEDEASSKFSSIEPSSTIKQNDKLNLEQDPLLSDLFVQFFDIFLLLTEQLNTTYHSARSSSHPAPLLSSSPQNSSFSATGSSSPFTPMSSPMSPSPSTAAQASEIFSALFISSDNSPSILHIYCHILSLLSLLPAQRILPHRSLFSTRLFSLISRTVVCCCSSVTQFSRPSHSPLTTSSTVLISSPSEYPEETPASSQNEDAQSSSQQRLVDPLSSPVKGIETIPSSVSTTEIKNRLLQPYISPFSFANETMAAFIFHDLFALSSLHPLSCKNCTSSLLSYWEIVKSIHKCS
eukprot:MONOS_311.1-p1 / transcript=MONOS_311.1 / gene=MONOS_311 / organism=Monocercomonoides_exilis_PA203 / gene_product=Threonine synthase 2 / transcript_product=Threonine synthase 2 / location=Mono_scaffold00005:114594-118007(-) / protein_length=1138 / sequence_SO=supercontig / SO=protein_coding / is_pseudo=false